MQGRRSSVAWGLGASQSFGLRVCPWAECLARGRVDLDATERAHKRNGGQVDAEGSRQVWSRKRVTCSAREFTVFKMSNRFPPDPMLEKRAVEKMRKLLLKQTFMERWEPVCNELKWVIGGRASEQEHQKILPDYCYNIFDLYKRTIYIEFAPITDVITIKDNQRAATCKTVEEAKQVMTVDWNKLGSVFSAGERCTMFFENEAEPLLKQDGLLDLSSEQDKEIYELFIGDRWMNKKLAEIQAHDPSKPVEEIIEARLTALQETTKKAVPDWHQKAREWEPGAVTEFHKGVAKGSAGFLDKAGELKGERKIKLKETYEILLICWPEIDEMLKAKPPKTRNQLWDWLRPFSYAQWIEIQDLDQLNRLCTEIKLKLTKPGAPRKVR